jgi:predicted SAM-dependent methyltransferase
MRIELGCGNRPTRGYLHQDVIQLETPLDYCCNAWELPIAEGSLDECIAIAVMEHLRFDDFSKTLKHIHRLLNVGGVFYFDVPDLYVWSSYLFFILHGHKDSVPYTKEDIIKTMWGWQRWPGDEHKSMWTKEDVYSICEEAGFKVENGFEDIKERVWRDRFNHPENAHIFIKAIK